MSAAAERIRARRRATRLPDPQVGKVYRVEGSDVVLIQTIYAAGRLELMYESAKQIRRREQDES